MREMHAARIGRDLEIAEGVYLIADLLRHFWKIDPVVPQQRVAFHLRLQNLPDGEEAIGLDALRKIARQQRRVVIAQVLAEPAQPAQPVFFFVAKRQQECDLAVGETADDNRRSDALPRSDMLLPRVEPV